MRGKIFKWVLISTCRSSTRVSSARTPQSARRKIAMAAGAFALMATFLSAFVAPSANALIVDGGGGGGGGGGTGLATRTLSISATPTALSVLSTSTALATPSSGTGTITYALDTGSDGGCAVNASSGVVSESEAGTCYIEANIASDGTYESVSTTTDAVVVFSAATAITLEMPNFSETVDYGRTSGEILGAVVSTTGSHLPTGTVTFVSGATTLCSTSLLLPIGAHSVLALCVIGNTPLPVGTYAVSASYSGDANNAESTSSRAGSLTVVKDQSLTYVSVAPSRVTFNNESAAAFNVRVVTRFGGPMLVSESVTVYVGSTSCVATITPTFYGGSGSCTISNAALLASNSRYVVSATYDGDANVAASNTAYAWLRVVKETKTTGRT